MAAIDELVALSENLVPSGEIGDGMVAKFHELAARVRAERETENRLAAQRGPVPIPYGFPRRPAPPPTSLQRNGPQA